MQLKKPCKNSHPPPPIHCTSSTPTFFIGREVFGVRHGSSSLKHLRIRRTTKKKRTGQLQMLLGGNTQFVRQELGARTVGERGRKEKASHPQARAPQSSSCTCCWHHLAKPGVRRAWEKHNTVLLSPAAQILSLSGQKAFFALFISIRCWCALQLAFPGTYIHFPKEKHIQCLAWQ